MLTNVVSLDGVITLHSFSSFMVCVRVCARARARACGVELSRTAKMK